MFKNYLTIKIIDAIYILTLIGCVLLGAVSLFTGNKTGFIVAAFFLVFSRIFFEVIIVQFKQAETLNKILEVLQGRDINNPSANEHYVKPEPQKDLNAENWKK